MSPTLRTTIVALAIASGLGVLEILRSFVGRSVVVVHGGSVVAVAHRIMMMGGTLVIASPWCAFMARRFPFRKGRAWRTLLAHVGGGAVFVAIHMALNLVAHTAITGETPRWGLGLLRLYGFYVGLELSVYALIVLVLLLLEARREAAERAIAAAQLTERLTAARLESLQAQIRPHFLFNTLNALAVLARKGDGAQVDRALGDLGELLRASFETPGRHEIRLGEELEFLDRYVHLQRIRFPDRLEVEWRIDDDARHAYVPALLVQPIVENAIEHGLATVRGGRVRVAARRAGDTLEIEVEDDGPGFGADAVEHDGGTGLANTRERLVLLYGERATLECGDRPGGGGTVRLRLPWRTRPRVEPAA